MRGRKLRLACAVGVATLTLVTAGCSSDSATPPASAPSGGTAAPAGDSTAGSTTSTTVAQDVDLDTELAEKARLEAIDLPGGPWSQPAPRSGSSSSSSNTDITCADPPPHLDLLNKISKVPHAKTGNMTNTATKQKIEEEIDVFASVGQAEDLTSAMNDPKFIPCLQDTMTSSVNRAGAVTAGTVGPNGIGTVPGLSTFSMDVGRFDVDQVGDDVIGLAVSLKGAGLGDQVSILVFVRVGRSVILLTFDGKPLPGADDVHALAELAVTKLTNVMESK